MITHRLSVNRWSGICEQLSIQLLEDVPTFPDINKKLMVVFSVDQIIQYIIFKTLINIISSFKIGSCVGNYIFSPIK